MELYDWWPALRNELLKEEATRDYIKLIFKNGSQLDIMPAQETTRGQRKHAGLLEEVRDCLNISFPVITGVSFYQMMLTGKSKFI